MSLPTAPSLPDADSPGVRVWCLVLGQVPLFVADVGSEPLGAAAALYDACRDHGLEPAPAFFGHDVPKTPPRVGLTLKDRQLVLEDDDGDALLRLDHPPPGDPWVDRALEVKGTLAYLARGLDAEPDADVRKVARSLDQAARDGRALAGIVGVARPRDTLPIFG